MSEKQRIVEFNPAFDRRDPDPSKNYGIHGVTIRFLLKGDNGVVQFVLHTNWHLPHVTKETLAKCKRDPSLFDVLLMPMPSDLGYHSPVPMYDGQTMMIESCPVLDGKPCYYDGSSLNAEPIYEVLLREGHNGVWQELEKYYNRIFKRVRS